MVVVERPDIQCLHVTAYKNVYKAGMPEGGLPGNIIFKGRVVGCMRVIAVDDEELNLEIFRVEVDGLKDVELVGTFQNPVEALDFASENPVDIAVLDIEMPELNGIELGQRLKLRYPNIALVYLTGYKEYAFDAFQLEASAYLTKPYFRKDIEYAISRAVKLSEKAGVTEANEKAQPAKADKPHENDTGADVPRIFIRTFGHFEIFVNGKPVEFSSSKAKELLALLVDRKGGIVTTDEMITYLWEDRPDDEKSRNLCRKVVQRLHARLKENGIDDIILRHNRGRSLDVSKVNCDYYQYLQGNEERRNEFHGEYMTNYSWAEDTLATLL
jgi:two-component SAPR family response regulator